jgi:hypothetical protein
MLRQFFWSPMLLDGVRDQAVAEKLLDMTVFIGLPVTESLLRLALNALGQAVSLIADKMNPWVLTAVNAVDAAMLLIELKAHLLGFLVRQIQIYPERAKNWERWKARAEA